MKQRNSKVAPPIVTPLLHDIPETQVMLGGVSRTTETGVSLLNPSASPSV